VVGDRLADLMVKGWRVETDCGPCVRLIQDTYHPNQKTCWYYPDLVGESRYVHPARFDDVAAAMVKKIVETMQW